ncbi:BolA family protein [Wenzhouxiangella sp. XN24]|uniref:BolA family protein n=1 Tax=Wenzhouxiangella sp. XN24 TaxID=2713569 RepID=UPI0013EA0050|nr:BolA family protein [Wenzhouxiangella sp. XN24]NGX15202.1 BolA family transcriptional regulator [Wenzhouxiangella sp. XN24]
MNTEDIASLIRQGLAVTTVEVESEDNTHFAALVVSEDFDGLRPLQRHQLVYRALGDKMGGEIHALSIRALTPAELAAGA